MRGNIKISSKSNLFDQISNLENIVDEMETASDAYVSEVKSANGNEIAALSTEKSTLASDAENVIANLRIAISNLKEYYQAIIQFDIPSNSTIQVKNTTATVTVPSIGEADSTAVSKNKTTSFGFQAATGIAVTNSSASAVSNNLFGSTMTGNYSPSSGSNPRNNSYGGASSNSYSPSSSGSSVSTIGNSSPRNSSSSETSISSQSNTNNKTSNSGELRTNNNSIIDTSAPYTQGTPYNLSESEINTLAYIAYREQGSVEGAKLELSLMCNLYEKNKSRYSSVYDYVQHSGWFGAATSGYNSAPSNEYYKVAEDVLLNGNRYLPTNVVEHDCLSDISYATNNGASISVYDRSAYVPGETVLHNVYGANYIFVGFAPNGGDPFGYLV